MCVYFDRLWREKRQCWLNSVPVWSTAGTVQCCGSALASSKADPDPAFYLSADLDPGSQTNADPDLDPDHGQTMPSFKSWIFQRLESRGFFCKFWSISLRSGSAFQSDPDPG